MTRSFVTAAWLARRSSTPNVRPWQGKVNREHKYVTEDVPCGLVAMSAFGHAAGVTTPVIDGLIALSGAMPGRDFVKEGRTLESLGLAGKSVEAIKRIFAIGLTASRSRWSGVN